MFFFLSILIGAFSFVPVITFAQNTGLVPCGTKDINGDGMIKDLPGAEKEECQFNDLLKLVSNIVDFLIITGTAVAALSFGYAGFLMMTANGEMGKIEEAKAIFGKVMTGFIIMLSAWLIVYAIESAFLDSSFTSYIR